MSMASDGYAPITALLGPTNTGKTHRAVQRLLDHPTGMIGLPLRLLAREIYDRVTARVGESAVALVTGEEKRIPTRPRYWVCTVEAMPLAQEVDFLAVDEVQLVGHPQRGHVFTDRLLHARGARETWYLGADTVRPLLEQLVPTARVQGHPRLSRLTHAGRSTLRALPPRSAVVAFGVPQVYEMGERLRRTRGGAAIVLGALSPRTRNAQVAMYQAGEVDYLAATDAIGMGLNLDVDHVAFAATHKFDGRESRPLEAAELAQIAGRAGRYLNDGTFGTLAPEPELNDAVAAAIEQHRFAPLRTAWWRSDDLDFSSIDSLLASLQKHPRQRGLRWVDRAVDYECLRLLARSPAVRRAAWGTERVRLLWQACQIPNFSGSLVEHHAQLVEEVFAQLAGRTARLDPDWLDQNVRRLDDPRGDVDTLMLRIELTRTWTYVSHQARWVADAGAWQARTQGIEERLSDALHEQLVQRFVEPGHAVASRTRKRRRSLAPPTESEPDQRGGPFAKLLDVKLSLAEPPPSPPVAGDSRYHTIADAAHDRFSSDSVGRVCFDGEVIGQLTRGADLLRPEVKVIVPDGAGAGARSRLQRRLVAWARDLVAELLEVLRDERWAALSGAGRGVMYQLEQGLGTVAVRRARSEIEALRGEDRKLLASSGIVLGVRHVYARALIKPHAVEQRVALCRAFLGDSGLVPEPGPATVSLPVSSRIAAPTCVAIGFPLVGGRAIRSDFIERIDARLRDLARQGPFSIPAEIAPWLGCPEQQVPQVVEGLGYQPDSEGRYVRRRRSSRGRSGSRRRRRSGGGA